jgi:hypothetical protein
LCNLLHLSFDVIDDATFLHSGGLDILQNRLDYVTI